MLMFSELINIWISLVMTLVVLGAAKLRWFSMFHNVADATSGGDAGDQITNESQKTMHVKVIHSEISITAAGPAEDCTAELSTQASFNAAPTNESEYRLKQTAAAPPTDGSSGNDGDVFYMSTIRYMRGELPLETGESLFSNILGSSGGSKTARYLIGVEYES